MSELGAWPCRVCSKGVAANSLQCTSDISGWSTCVLEWGEEEPAGSECSIRMQEASGRDSSSRVGRRHGDGWKEVWH